MPAAHLVFLVEEPSMETFLRELVPRLIPRDKTFDVHAFQGKSDLLEKIEARLRAYALWLPGDWRIVVVVDRDDDDCRQLKQQLEEMAESARLRTRTRAGAAPWQLVNRIAIEELEAWYFGDWEAVRAVYPRVPAGIHDRRGFRDPDAIAGGTWEAFERVLQKHGHVQGGLPKLKAARLLGRHVHPSRSRSKSFQLFCAALNEAVAGPPRMTAPGDP